MRVFNFHGLSFIWRIDLAWLSTGEEEKNTNSNYPCFSVNMVFISLKYLVAKKIAHLLAAASNSAFSTSLSTATSNHPGACGRSTSVLWISRGAQENRPDIPVGAITHHRGTGATRTARVYVVHRSCVVQHTVW